MMDYSQLNYVLFWAKASCYILLAYWIHLFRVTHKTVTLQEGCHSHHLFSSLSLAREKRPSIIIAELVSEGKAKVWANLVGTFIKKQNNHFTSVVHLYVWPAKVEVPVKKSIPMCFGYI